MEGKKWDDPAATPEFVAPANEREEGRGEMEASRVGQRFALETASVAGGIVVAHGVEGGSTRGRAGLRRFVGRRAPEEELRELGAAAEEAVQVRGRQPVDLAV